MDIKINDKMISIPPYISTQWSRISSLHMKGNALCIALQQGESLLIPNLNPDVLKQIFQAHASFMEQENDSRFIPIARGPDNLKSVFDQMADTSIRLAISSLDGLETITQHNPSQADSPDLPEELLAKIKTISDLIPPGKELILPKTEPSCNCFHCQITRALHGEEVIEIDEAQEEVSDDDLHFQQWNVIQIGADLFTVSNKLDSQESYRVYLGQPVGCTCGKGGEEGCEHILAALRS